MPDKSPAKQKPRKPSVPKAKATAEEISSLSIGTELDKFIKHIDSLRISFPLTEAILKVMQDKNGRDLNSFLRKHYETEIKEGKTSFELKQEHAFRYQQLNKRIESATISIDIVPRSLLVALISQFDSFLGGLLKVLFYLRPELLSSSEKSISFAELVEFASVENAQEHIIEKEIETVLRKSHSDQFAWLENKFSLPLRKELPAWKTFIELTERRNLFVHANGIVSSQYLKICKEYDVILEPKINIGKQLSVTKDYFISAYKTIYEIGFKLGHVLWRKQHPDDIAQADHHLNNATFMLLKEGKYSLALNLLDFATIVLKKHSNDQQRLILVVNRAQAYKWSGKLTESQAILDEEDWTARGIEFKLSASVLRDDFTLAAKIMREIGPSSFPTKSDYGEWPLFRDFRKSKEFLEAFLEIFKEKFELFVIEEENLTLTLGPPPNSKPKSGKSSATKKKTSILKSTSKRSGH
jgi:hypothetical protein